MQFLHADKRPNTADWDWQTTDPFSRQRAPHNNKPAAVHQ
jgi:hypothetical protein